MKSKYKNLKKLILTDADGVLLDLEWACNVWMQEHGFEEVPGSKLNYDMSVRYGIPKEQVIFPNPNDYRFGLAQPDLAALYSRMDVLLAPSLGEGFGVPSVEAQACGTRVIGSNWAATPDLISEDSWLVDGQLSWDAGQDAWWMTPNVGSLVNALEESYKAERGPSQVAIDFASQFDVEKVWDESWVPILKKLL
jgi:glycosyltransferase involved in cell wall biosynthesis